MAATARRIIQAAELYAVLQRAYDATPEDGGEDEGEGGTG